MPGIGASIRISFAAKANLISSCNCIILLTLIPVSSFNSYLVTEGPIKISLIEALTPNSWRTLVNASAFSKAFPLLSPDFLETGFFNTDKKSKSSCYNSTCFIK